MTDPNYVKQLEDRLIEYENLSFPKDCSQPDILYR